MLKFFINFSQGTIKKQANLVSMKSGRKQKNASRLE